MQIEQEFQKCVELAGGERVSCTFGESPNFQDADFIFKNYNVISELKSLEEDKIHDERIIEQASNLYIKELNNNQAPAIAFGTVMLTTHGFSQEFTRAIIELYKKPIINSIKKANRQIRETKQAFEAPDYLGLLILANNSHSALDPWHANFILEEILQKPDFSSVNTVIYLTAKQAVITPGDREECGVWIVKHRNGLASVPEALLDMLRKIWFSHLTALKGKGNHQEFLLNNNFLAALENKKA